MPRKPSDKPWLHAPSGHWCATVDGKRLYLDKDPRTAARKLRQIRTEQKRNGRTRNWLDASVGELADEFLTDLKAKRKPATYSHARSRLLRAFFVIPATTRVCDVRKIDLARIEQALTGKRSSTTVHATIARLQQVFSWAVEHELLDVNPLLGYRKPARRVRTRVVTPSEFQSMLRAASRNPAFRRFLIALRFTGCRPGEVRGLTWDMVDLDQRLWIIPDHKTVTTQRRPKPRIIPLPEPVWALCQWLSQKPHDEDSHVFLNMHGAVYTSAGLSQAMARIRKRANLPSKGGEQLVLYSQRHTYGTNAAGKVSDIELAEVMGHTDTHTTRRYVHLNAARLLDIQRRIRR